METRIMHSYETKMKVVEMKIEGYSNQYIQKELGIKNKTQIETWWSWYRKITALIRRERNINKKTVQRIMQKFDCQCRVKIKHNYKNRYQAIVMDNIMNRDFRAVRPFEKLVTDITYLPYGNKLMYLSSIMDLYNG